MIPQHLSLPRVAGRELLLIWRFVNNDIWDTVIPCIITFTTAWIYAARPLQELPFYACYCLVYTLLYILTFCMTNQLYGVEEDKINKPDRPLVAGLISIEGAQRRLLGYNILFLLVAIPMKLFWLALSWQLITKMLCQWGFSNHWALKNLFCISLGTANLLAAEWLIVADISHRTWAYIGFISLWAGMGLPLQDMRDQAGDRIMGRKTLPIALGDNGARIALSLYLALLSPVIYYGAVLTQVPLSSVLSHPVALAVLIVEVLWHWCIALRLWWYQSPREDDRTYHWFVYLFCLTIPLICVL
ncbi:UbiA family prenyltransferase [Chitinophaga horti]|uniref:UbiA family prenyltransferase n=1 Tax=Chitinophaga horti TaxID=2920382 RepID=A0ABY6J3U5_9BACT|nr:UbiA family prenyltransferase [Chitinophaga horti]UYQ94350.1 UbiA family prenyltransferase [Chitinophaga horti]